MARDLGWNTYEQELREDVKEDRREGRYAALEILKGNSQIKDGASSHYHIRVGTPWTQSGVPT